MDHLIDLDPTHGVLRITVTTPVMDDEAFKQVYGSIARFAATGGPYAAIFDLSQVKDFRVSSDTIEAFAAGAPAVPSGRHHVIVAPQSVVNALLPMFELHGESMGEQVQLTHSMDEAYKLLGARAEDFTQRLFPERMAA
jgi:hypothetical protein